MPMRDRAHYADEGFVAEDLEFMEVDEVEYIDCSFERCSFGATAFRKCHFVDCTFDACDLSNSTWVDSSFSGVKFEECKAIGIDWTVASWPAVTMRDAIAFKDSALNHCTFLGLKLPGLQVTGCVAREADFRDADLSGADFSGTDLTGSLFSSTNLVRADFTTARNYRIPPAENRMTGAKFSLPEAIALLHCMDIELVE
jgi:uncharacterized protein YjbI with pentapeptide repeats